MLYVCFRSCLSRVLSHQLTPLSFQLNTFLPPPRPTFLPLPLSFQPLPLRPITPLSSSIPTVPRIPCRLLVMRITQTSTCTRARKCRRDAVIFERGIGRVGGVWEGPLSACALSSEWIDAKTSVCLG